MLSDADMRERMVNGWRMGKPETVCGNGSTLAATENIREWLPKIVTKYGIVRINDAGAGDMYWIRRVCWLVAYRAYDLIPRTEDVTPIDITSEPMPACDAILCRMVLNHLDEPRNLAALGLFKRRARFLIATQFNGDDLPQRSPQFTRLDLRKAPYDLGEPLESIQDGHEPICRLALWRLC